MTKYLFVLERTETGFSAYVPDLPGCVATGASEEELGVNIREAIAFHLDGMREEGYSIPTPSSSAAYSEVHTS